MKKKKRVRPGLFLVYYTRSKQMGRFFMIGEELDFLNSNERWNRDVSPLNIMICTMFIPWKFRL